jgi:chemotaxis protein MotA
MGIDPIGLVWVLLGSLIVATLQCGWGAMRAAVSHPHAILRHNPDETMQDAAKLMQMIRRLVARSGIWAVDQLAPAHPDMAAMVHIASRHIGTPDYAQRLFDFVDRHDRQKQAAISWWLAMAEAAPAMGMIGTVFGMIQLFATPGPAQMGPGLALALHTTLYGLILASLIAGPMAQRLASMAQHSRSWQMQLSDCLVGLPQQGKIPA